MNDGIDLFGYLKALQRRWWLIALCALFGSAAAVGVAVVLPPVYQSSAKILVESQQIPDELARSTVTSSAVERLELIKQRLMTRDNLLDVIERLNLYADRPDLTPTEKVDLVRQSATIQNLALGGGRRGQRTVSAFVISYDAENPQTAARVANEFVTIVLEQNLETRSRRATETLEFFRDEVTRLSSSLLALEAEIANYKNNNEESLPDTLNFRHNELNTVDERLVSNEQMTMELNQRRAELVAAKESGRPEQVAERDLTQEERDLNELRRTLLQKEAVFAPTHPEIRTLKARINALESVVLGAPNDEPEVATDAIGEEARAASLLDQQIALLDSRLSLLQNQKDTWLARKAELEDSISATPDVEMALSAYDRRYRDLQNQYSLAVRKQAEAATGEKLEVNRQSERFEIIEQARVAEEPIAPARQKIAAAGIGGSLIMGVGLVLLLELLFGAVHTSSDLERRLNMRPLGAIPYIPTREDRLKFWLRWITALVTMIAAVAFVLWMIDQYYLPLQLIAANIGDKFDPASLWQIIKSRLL